MVSQAVIDHRKTVLRARGVPERFVDALARRRGSKSETFFKTMTLIGLLLAVMLGSTSLAGLAIPDVTRVLYRHEARTLLFYLPDIQSSLGILFFIWLAVPLIVMLVRAHKKTRPAPHSDTRASALRELGRDEDLLLIKPIAFFADYSDLSDDTTFLDAALPPDVQRARASGYFPAMVITLALLAPLIIFAFDAVDYRTVTADRIVVHNMFKTRDYSLAKAKRVIVLCRDYLTGPRFSYSLIYDDETFNLWKRDNLHDLDDPGLARRLARIDTALKTAGVPIVRLPANGSPGIDANMCASRLIKGWKRVDRRAFEALAFGQTS